MLFVALLIVASLIVVFRLGNQASAGVALSDPVVWVEDGARGRLLQINGSTQEITAAIDVGEDGDSLVAIPRGRDAVYLNRTTGQLGVVTAVSLEVEGDEDLLVGGQPLTGDDLQILADLRVSTDAYIVAPRQTLVHEPGAGERRTILTPDGLGSTVVDAQGRLVAVTVDAARIGVSSEEGLVPLAELPPPLGPDAEPPGLARAGDSLYVVDAARRTVNEVLEDGELGPTMCVAGSLANVRIGGNELTESTGVHRVLVHDSEAGVLSVTDVAENDCYEIDLNVAGSEFGDPVAVDDIAYLPNYETGDILIVDLEERLVLDTVTFSLVDGRPFELEVFDGAVWANEPQGRRVAVITPDETRLISKIQSIIFSGEVPEGASGDGSVVIDGGDEGERAFQDEDGDLSVLDPDGGDEDGSEGGEDVDGGDDEGDGDPASSEDETSQDQNPEDLVDSPILDVIEQPDDPQPNELIANFVFSASTVNVGEEVSFSDESTGNPTSWNWDFGDGTGAQGPDVTKIWDSEGVFTVTLFVANDAGEEAQQSLDVTVVAVDVLRVPTADFTFRSDTVEVGETIEFVDASTGEPDTLLWSFGDGTTASGSVVSHVFEEAGAFEVSLTASNEAGLNTTSAVITVVEGVQPPEAIIGRFPGVVEVGQTVTLTSDSTNSPTSISWGFGDGDSALGTTVRHAWKSPGTFRIRLSVSNSAAADETFADIVVEPRVNPPTARFGQSALEVVEGQVINFNDLSLNNPDRLTWEFGDGATAQGANVSHAWDEPGTYTVTLTATNDAGSDDVAKTVTVIPLPPDPPTAGFTVASATVPVNSVVNFTNTSTGDPTEFAWDFGDGASSVATSPPHGYSSPGTYEVTLTARNAGGSDSITKTIVVIDPPIASFTQTVNELAVTFADTSANDPTSWDWDFGDGTSSAAQNPTKTYAAAGTYTVTLIATNDAGSSAPFTTTVQVASAPVAGFTFVTGGLTAQFTDASSESPAFWSWDFGDGTTSSVQSPTHTYAAGGTYTVTLTVSNVAGSDSQTSAVTVMVAPPVASFTCQVIGGGVACDGSGSTGAATYAWSSSPAAVTSSGTATPNASFTYATSGTYNITLTVQNIDGTPDSVTQPVTVTVPQPPTITNISVDSNSNGVVQVTGTATESPTSWSWNAPGATIVGGTTATPTFTYTTSGSKTVTATATNGVGTSGPASETFTVTITPPPPVVTISNGGQTAGVINASASATNTPVTWSWSISPSGSVTSGQGTTNAQLTVTSNGTYTVTATATNPGGSDSDSFSITVNDIAPPAPVINSINQTESPAGSVAVSANTSGGSPTSWSWTVASSNEGSSTSANPTFTFNANGSYPGSVTATNPGGSDTFNFTINVSGFVPPDANFTLNKTGALQITVTGVAQANTTYAWTFGDGASGSGQSTTHTYAADNTYTVTLTVTRNGLTNSSSQNVTFP